MGTTEDHGDTALPAAKITKAATEQLALQKAYMLIDRYVAELAPDAPANPFTRELKYVKQPNDK